MNYKIHQHKFNDCITYLYSRIPDQPSFIIKNAEKIDKEYSFYQIPHPAFKSFDSYYETVEPDTIIKLGANELRGDQIYNFPTNSCTSILLGELNPSLITLFEHRHNCTSLNLIKQLINLYSNILGLKDECFKTFGFVHGDFKSNNILVNPDNLQSIQFIDFEFSMRFSSPNSTQSLKSNDMVLYLCVPESFEITGEFGRLFDIYLLALELKVFFRFGNNFIIEFEKLFVESSVESYPEGFIDFYLIIQMVKYKNKDELVYKSDDTYILSTELFTIRDTILGFDFDSSLLAQSNIPVLESRLGYLKSVIKNLK